MKKLNLDALELNEQDNVVTALAKGGLKGTIQGTLSLAAVWGSIFIVGKLMDKGSSEKKEA